MENGAEHHQKVGGACCSELLAEIRNMQQKMNVMEETISKLTKTKSGANNGTYIKLASSIIILVTLNVTVTTLVKAYATLLVLTPTAGT